MGFNRDALIDELITRQGAFFRTALGDSWLQVDLTMAQFKAACALAIDQPATVGALGQRLGIGLPAASHIVERLVRLELADRYDDPNDRRRAYVRLTAAGEALIGQMRDGSRERIRTRLARLADDELTELNRLLQIMIEPGIGSETRAPVAAAQ
ncbi:MAG: MarR family transcriptional regulator, organic hydroperoxide resistance regulator [Chloroflexota bacterium]|nr:MarR family transcriptional regulator, organic hydroperoxide resistance regulator [Chloroflexota bacterium]